MQNALECLPDLNSKDGPFQNAAATKKEYRVITRVKNNLLLLAIEKAGYKSIAEFAAKANIGYHQLNNLINFKESPIDKKGDWRPIIEGICVTLNKMPSQLFTEKQLQIRNAQTKITEISEAEAFYALQSLPESNPQLRLEAMEDQQDLYAKLETLSPREKEIIMLFYGLESHEHTLDEISKKFGISRTRVRHIIDRAIRILNHSYTKKSIKALKPC